MDIKSYLPYIIKYARQWIKQQNSFYNANSTPLKREETDALKNYFQNTILENARLAFSITIKNPPFYNELSKAGITKLINFNDTAGITFGNCIVISKKFEHSSREFLSLLFHEMVHVVQYEILGIDKFVKEYFTGWIENDFSYYKIPLEDQAYKLQARFDKKLPPFPVLKEVTAKFQNHTP